MRVSYIEDTEKWISEFQFEVPLKVRFAEIDMFGHLNNVEVFNYFEYGRMEFLKALEIVPVKDWHKMENVVVVSDLQADYLQQVFYDDQLVLKLKIAHLGTTSMDIHYLAMHDEKKPVFVGRGRLVQMNRKTGRPVAWTDEQKERMDRI